MKITLFSQMLTKTQRNLFANNQRTEEEGKNGTEHESHQRRR